MGEITGVVAWYGATVATLTFLFNIVKWLRESPRLRVRILPTAYDDGGFSKVEQTPHGKVSTPNIYYHVEVINTGERATTIMGVAATSKETVTEKLRFSRIRNQGIVGYAGGAFKPHYNKILPFVVPPGEVWSCRVPADHIDGLQSDERRIKLEVTVSHKGKPLLVPFPMPTVKSAIHVSV